MGKKFNVWSLDQTLSNAYADVQFPQDGCMIGSARKNKITATTTGTNIITTEINHGFAVNDPVYVVGAVGSTGLALDKAYFVTATATSKTLTVAPLAGGTDVTLATKVPTNLYILPCTQDLNAVKFKKALVTEKFTRGAAGTNSAGNFKLMDWFSGTTYYAEQILTPGNPYVKAYDINYQTATIAAAATDAVKPVLVDIEKLRFKMQVKETQSNTGANAGTVKFKVEGELIDE